MKTKKLHKKLMLNKKTPVNLDANDLVFARGRADIDICPTWADYSVCPHLCPDTDYTIYKPLCPQTILLLFIPSAALAYVNPSHPFSTLENGAHPALRRLPSHPIILRIGGGFREWDGLTARRKSVIIWTPFYFKRR
jgi:hypothetical protein